MHRQKHRVGAQIRTWAHAMTLSGTIDDQERAASLSRYFDLVMEYKSESLQVSRGSYHCTNVPALLWHPHRILITQSLLIKLVQHLPRYDDFSVFAMHGCRWVRSAHSNYRPCCIECSQLCEYNLLCCRVNTTYCVVSCSFDHQISIDTRKSFEALKGQYIREGNALNFCTRVCMRARVCAAPWAERCFSESLHGMLTDILMLRRNASKSVMTKYQ